MPRQHSWKFADRRRHQREQCRIFDGKGDVPHPARFEPRLRILLLRDARRHGGRERRKALLRNGIAQRLLVGEVVVRRRRRYARGARDAPSDNAAKPSRSKIVRAARTSASRRSP